MLNFLFSLPGLPALAAALALLAFSLAVLRGNTRFLIIFGILLACRAAICAQHHLLFSGGGVLAVTAGSLSDFVFLAPFLFLKPDGKSRIAAMLCAAMVVAVNLMDTAYSLESGFRLQYMLIENLDLTAMRIRWEYSLLVLAGAGALLLLFHGIFSRLHAAPIRPGAAAALTFLCLLFFTAGLIEAPPLKAMTAAVRNAEPRAMLGIVADSAVRNFFQDAMRPAPNLHMPEQAYAPEERRWLRRRGLLGAAQALSGGAGALPAPDAPAYDRVVCVFIESLSYDFIGGRAQSPREAGTLFDATARTPRCDGATSAAAMPFLRSLLDDPRYPRLQAYHSSAFSTNEGIYAAMASRPDFGGDVLARRKVETLFSLAAQRGWATAYFLGTSGDFGHVSRNYARFLKVQNVYDRESELGLPPAAETSQWGDTDRRVFEKVFTWMRDRRRDRFIIGVSTIDTHPPFYQKSAPAPGMEDTPLNRALHSTDQALAWFVSSLEREGLLDARTLLIITADHQITHGGKVVLNALADGEFGNRHIPLIFVTPDAAPLRDLALAVPCSAVDIAPTLGDLLGLPEQSSYYGKSLFLPGGHYDLALTRDGVLHFISGEERLVFQLGDPPKNMAERALRKWYFNTQQGYAE